MPRSKGMVIGFWIATALFCMQMGFTAFAQLRLPQVAEAFTHLGFPAYAGFAITLGSALIAHLSVGDGPESRGWAAGTGVLRGLSYFFWRGLQAAPASAPAARPAGAMRPIPNER
jgi:hypothetical protein